MKLAADTSPAPLDRLTHLSILAAIFNGVEHKVCSVLWWLLGKISLIVSLVAYI